jgi:hypothetical protein
MVAPAEAMIIDEVDQADFPVGQIDRAEVFRLHAGFRVSHVFVFNSSGDLLIQRLALTRTRNPGAWGSSVASYLFASEDYDQAARRRVGEELGISAFTLGQLGKTEMIDDGCLKFISLFQLLNDGPFPYDRSHIDALEFAPVPAIKKMIEDGSRPFTPTFLRVFALYGSLVE